MARRALLIAALAALVFCALPGAQGSKCSARFGGHSVTAIVVADPGDFAETGEIHYLLANLQDRRNMTTRDSVCAKAYRGRLLGQPVVLVVSGIGPTAAALCLHDLLQCAAVIRDVVYMGTSGWSPQRGGLLNPDNCGAVSTGRQLTRIGDMCITPLAVNWVCKKADWTAQCGSYPNLCGRPREQMGPTHTAVFGKCLFASPGRGSFELADELLDAARRAAGAGLMPRRNARLQAWEAQYWGSMSANTGLNASVPADAAPAAWDYRSCVEVDSQFFYSGVPWELTARQYTADTINGALPGANVTDQDVIAVSAMEGVGLAEVMSAFNARPSTSRPIPWAIVRGNADWLHNVIGQSAPGVWEYRDPVEDDFGATYKYAIATSSAAVLTMLQGRCTAQLRAQRDASAAGWAWPWSTRRQQPQQAATQAQQQPEEQVHQAAVRPHAQQAQTGQAQQQGVHRQGQAEQGQWASRRSLLGWQWGQQVQETDCTFTIDYS